MWQIHPERLAEADVAQVLQRVSQKAYIKTYLL